MLAKFEAPSGQKTALPQTAMASPQQRQQGFVLVIETRQTVTPAADGGWQVSVQQLRWLVPVNRVQKQLPSKT